MSPTFLNAFFIFFSYASSFPIKMLAMDVKTQKIGLDLTFFMTDESFGGSVYT